MLADSDTLTALRAGDPVALAALFDAHFVDWSTTPEAVLLSAEAGAALEAAIRQLPESLRAIFLLRDVEGFSTEEAAEALGLSIAAARVRLHRARLALRERLAGYFGQSGVAP